MLRWLGIRKKSKRTSEIHPDEILIDSKNIAGLNRDQFEGRIEQPLSQRSFWMAGGLLVLLFVGYIARAGTLQIVNGAAYAERAKNNQLTEQTIFADRGIIEDRTGVPLAYNERASVGDDFAQRTYTTLQGLSHVVGYVKAPAKDSSGTYYRDEFDGMDGAEKAFNAQLGGQNGTKLSETDAKGAVVSESVVQPPEAGATLRLSIDANVTSGLYQVLADRATEAHAVGAAGVIMDVRTGELLAMTSYPEYSSQALEEGNKEAINSYNTNSSRPFLNRVTDGLYAPGSIIKPIMAAAGLQEGVITPNTLITSTGQLTLPNPYDSAHPSIFKDWRVNGTMTVRDAIAVSSDVFFYEVGGGFGSQSGIGVSKIDQYFKLFGYGSEAGLPGFEGPAGTIPTPEWKTKAFPDDPTWRIGDTYHTAIGQYGMQVTPLQAVREAAALANSGTLLTPSLIASTTPQGTKLPIRADVLEVVREGMRQGVTKGIATAINFPFVQPAAKTGTAQIGIHNENQNAWMIGFWPYDNPKYAFAVVLDRLPAGTLVGGASVMYDFFNWMHENAPQYLQ
ncbi:MAG TPA: penicillin-binding transpeptidase domain-containing protein [Candidatus Paceibacterota bacterium]|nr:penicillin-binding transpeptidase domain-containing protein [Candidatus Paceibacterota bacterium]